MEATGRWVCKGEDRMILPQYELSLYCTLTDGNHYYHADLNYSVPAHQQCICIVLPQAICRFNCLFFDFLKKSKNKQSFGILFGGCRRQRVFRDKLICSKHTRSLLTQKKLRKVPLPKPVVCHAYPPCGNKLLNNGLHRINRDLVTAPADAAAEIALERIGHKIDRPQVDKLPGGTCKIAGTSAIVMTLLTGSLGLEARCSKHLETGTRQRRQSNK